MKKQLIGLVLLCGGLLCSGVIEAATSYSSCECANNSDPNNPYMKPTPAKGWTGSGPYTCTGVDGGATCAVSQSGQYSLIGTGALSAISDTFNGTPSASTCASALNVRIQAGNGSVCSFFFSKNWTSANGGDYTSGGYTCSLHQYGGQFGVTYLSMQSGKGHHYICPGQQTTISQTACGQCYYDLGTQPWTQFEFKK